MKERPILFNGEMVQAILDGRKTQTRRVIKPQPKCTELSGRWYWEKALDSNGNPLVDASRRWWEYYGTSPYGGSGDQLWVRETFADVNSEEGPALLYRADRDIRTWREFSKTFGPDYGAGPSMDYDAYPGDYCMWWTDLLNGEPGHGWKSPIHMPRWASRIQLSVKDVRVERVQDISEEDASAEGCCLEWYSDMGGTEDLWPCPSCAGQGTHGALGQNLGYMEVDCNDCDTSKKMFQHLWDSINVKRGFGWEVNPWVWVVEFEMTSN